jgi:hypothetical protein
MRGIVDTVCSGVVLWGLLFVALAGRAAAQDRRLWGGLEPGPHAVGFARSWQLDHARRYAPEFRTDGAGVGPARESPDRSW